MQEHHAPPAPPHMLPAYAPTSVLQRCLEVLVVLRLRTLAFVLNWVDVIAFITPSQATAAGVCEVGVDYSVATYAPGTSSQAAALYQEDPVLAHRFC